MSICPLCKRRVTRGNRKKIRKKFGGHVKSVWVHGTCKGVSKMAVDMNDFATEITKKEAGKTEISIAQVKEVLKLTFEKLATMTQEEVMEIVKRYKK
jgi:uncharacterized protein (DUF2267 family)